MQDKYYSEIKEKIIKVKIYDKVNDFIKDKNRVKIYFEIGEILSKAGKEYGKNIIKNYSLKLTFEVDKHYNYRTLYRMRKFYEIFSNEKLTPMVSKLSWSHYIELLSLKNVEEIIYYINLAVSHNLSKRELNNKIKSQEYERLTPETKVKLLNLNNIEVHDLVPNPIIIKNENLTQEINEYALKQLILKDLDNFLFQLGVGFSYIGSEYKIKLDDRYNYIDLLLYNIKYKCYVVIEIKVTELKKEHTGQIMIYMNYIDKNIKTSEENPTVGIIICKSNNNYVIEYCSDERIISKEYKLEK